jgi:hypothetical protein
LGLCCCVLFVLFCEMVLVLSAIFKFILLNS